MSNCGYRLYHCWLLKATSKSNSKSDARPPALFTLRHAREKRFQQTTAQSCTHLQMDFPITRQPRCRPEGAIQASKQLCIYIWIAGLESFLLLLRGKHIIIFTGPFFSLVFCTPDSEVRTNMIGIVSGMFPLQNPSSTSETSLGDKDCL